MTECLNQSIIIKETDSIRLKTPLGRWSHVCLKTSLLAALQPSCPPGQEHSAPHNFAVGALHTAPPFDGAPPPLQLSDDKSHNNYS